MIDFGNGIEAGGTSRDDPRIYDHSGLRYPTVVVPVSENSGDGGVIGTSRAKARRMSVAMDFSTLTRQQVAAAFSPGVLRAVSSDRGSMPYYVEDLVFVDPDNASASFGAVVTMVSEYAYPLGALTEAASILEYTTSNPTAGGATLGDYVLPLYDGYWHAFETFTLAGNGAVTNFGPYSSMGVGSSLRVGIFNTSAGLPTTQVGDWIDVVLQADGYALAPDVVALSAGAYALVWSAATDDTFRFWQDLAAGFAGGAGGIRLADGSWALGWLTDATIDWWHSIDIGQTSAAPAAIVVASESDVLCAPVITCTLQGADTALVVSDGTRTTTITHAFSGGEVVVLDSANLTVTIDGTDAIADFGRTGDFPMLSAGNTTITFDPGCTIAVEWRPRKLGLL